MPRKPKEKKDSYQVGTKDVKVAVDVGLSQIGRVMLFLEDKLLLSSPAPVGLFNLGSGAGLAGQLMTIDVTVTDASLNTNRMNVIVRLDGGKAAKTITLTDEVDEQGDTRDFRVFVLFKE